MQNTVRLIILLMGLFISTNAWALDPVYTGLFSDDAIKGYDTVAYFTDGKPVKGRKEFSMRYKEANWLFSSQENLELFRADPEKYAPQYGGYCAYAVANNTTASIQPELFTIHQGKLYLNYNESVNQKWLADKEAFVERADENWPGLLAE